MRLLSYWIERRRHPGTHHAPAGRPDLRFEEPGGTDRDDALGGSGSGAPNSPPSGSGEDRPRTILDEDCPRTYRVSLSEGAWKPEWKAAGIEWLSSVFGHEEHSWLRRPLAH